MTMPLPLALQQFIDANGTPLAGGTVGYYVPNTMIPKLTYQDAASTTPNSSVITLDANGRASVWGSGNYRQIVKDVNGNIISDAVTQGDNPFGFFTAGLTGGTANAQTISATSPAGFTLTDGNLLSFRASQANTGALSLNVLGLGNVPVVKYSSSGYTSLSGGEIIANGRTLVSYDNAGYFLLITYVPSTQIITEIGSMKLWPTNTAPNKWYFCDGSPVSRTTFSQLYSLVGTSWGAGDGSTTFNLPDFRGLFIMGANNSALPNGANGATTAAALAASGGATTVTLDTTMLPNHAHTFNSGSVVAAMGNNSGGAVAYQTAGGNRPSFNLVCDAVGGGLPAPILNPYKACNFIIYAGV